MRRNSSSPNRYTSSLSNSGGGPSSLIQSAGLAYPFLYPNTYHLAAAAGFPTSPAGAGPTSHFSSAAYSTSGSAQQLSTSERSTTAAAGSSSQASTSNSNTSSSGNSRRNGKKKGAPHHIASQSQNPEFRLFFNLRRRDQTVQSNKGSQAHHHQHVYKPKNPLTLQEW